MLTLPCESGGTGRRARLRGVWFTPYGFKSRFSHQQRKRVPKRHPFSLFFGAETDLPPLEHYGCLCDAWERRTELGGFCKAKRWRSAIEPSSGFSACAQAEIISRFSHQQKENAPDRVRFSFADAPNGTALRASPSMLRAKKRVAFSSRPTFLAPTYVAFIDAGNDPPEAKRLPVFFMRFFKVKTKYSFRIFRGLIGN